MSTLSFIDSEFSDRLAKRYASLVLSYFESPDDAKIPDARIPLENLYRILQMYRYDDFSDECRSGILELGEAIENADFSPQKKCWHENIESALNRAFDSAYEDVPKAVAVGHVQTALSWLASANVDPVDDIEKPKQFLNQFVTELA